MPLLFKKKKYQIQAFIYLSFSVLFLYGCQKKEETLFIRPVRALQLVEAHAGYSHAFPGRTQAAVRSNLAFRVEGQLIEKVVSVGDHVKKGDLLARLDPSDFEIESHYVSALVDKAKADLRFADNNHSRAQRIWEEDTGAISESLVEQREEERNRLVGEVKALEAKMSESRARLDYTTLRAPFDGVIVASYLQNFEYVKPKQPVLRLLNTSRIEMVIDVPESIISEIIDVDHVDVEFDAIKSKKFKAKIEEVGTEASLTTRTYPITLIVDQTDESAQIFAGMSGKAFLHRAKKQPLAQDSFVLPPSALITDATGDKTYVWIVNLDTMCVEKKEVEKSGINSLGVNISGLQPGLWVVTAGVHFLKEGQQVRLHPVLLDNQGNQCPIESL